MAYNEKYVLGECPRVKRGLTVCKKLKQVRHMNAMNFSTCRLNIVNYICYNLFGRLLIWTQIG